MQRVLSFNSGELFNYLIWCERIYDWRIFAVEVSVVGVIVPLTITGIKINKKSITN